MQIQHSHYTTIETYIRSIKIFHIKKIKIISLENLKKKEALINDLLKLFAVIYKSYFR